MGEAAEGQWKAGVSVFLRASSVVFPGTKDKNEKTTVTRGETWPNKNSHSQTQRAEIQSCVCLLAHEYSNFEMYQRL